MNLFRRITKWLQKLFGRLPDKQKKSNEANNIGGNAEVPKPNNFVEPSITETPQSIISDESQYLDKPTTEKIRDKKNEPTTELLDENLVVDSIVEEIVSTSDVPQLDEIHTKTDLSDKEEVSETKEVKEIESKKERKPYSKKGLYEEKNIKGATTDKEKKQKTQRVINLGNTQRWRRRREQVVDRTTVIDTNEGYQQEELETQQRNKTFIKSPFVELNLDEATIYLVLPQQPLGNDEIYNSLKKLTYKIKLNNKEREVTAKIKQRRNGNSFVEEIKIPIEEPLQEFEIIYPSELEDRIYAYRHHNDKIMYVFFPKGNNKAKMDYLFNENGEKNLLLRKKLWILLHEDYELLAKPENIEESFPWNSYQLFHLDLRNIEVLKISNRKYNSEEDFPTIPTFHLEGEQVEDDFKFECPLFIGNTLKLFAPNENSDGWNVWIQNSFGDFKLQENWNGNEPLLLYPPDDLPSEYGEFQVDICQQGTRVPDDVLFFRYIPHIQLNYPRELIIPDPTVGHKTEMINVKLSEHLSWEIKIDTNEFVNQINSSVFKISLPSEKDTISFSINKQNENENSINSKITLPRLKWRISRKESWCSITILVKRNKLVYGEDFSVFVMTNDFENNYNICGKLESDGNVLQRASLLRKIFEYEIRLNSFFDAIKNNKDTCNFFIEVFLENKQLSKLILFKIPPVLRKCKVEDCGFSTYEHHSMLHHFQSNHLNDFVVHLSYEEMRKIDATLPQYIYKCSHCDYYSRNDDRNNPTTAITEHIEDTHPGPICFRVVTDINEIRENVFPDIPYLYKCGICSRHFENFTEDDKVNHFSQNHYNEFVELQED
ncbi:MAG: hypothetical protein KJ666_07960 [Bacteroidetes bacterium]|nr:hypothetical protein [Bacteroidota bacterium]